MRERFWEALSLVTLAVLLGLGVNQWRGLPLSPVQPFVPRYSAPVLTLAQVREYWGKVPFLDAREHSEYSLGHIPGALCLPASRLHLPEQAWDAIDRNLTLVVYCDGPNCGASNLVASAAMTAGFKSVYLFPGGWPAWKAARLPVHVGPDPGKAEK